MKRTSKIIVTLCIIFYNIAFPVVSFGTDTTKQLLNGLNGQSTNVNTANVQKLGNSNNCEIC